MKEEGKPKVGRAVSTLKNSTDGKSICAGDASPALGRQYAGDDPHFLFDKGL
jgi:hypothetical protein